MLRIGLIFPMVEEIDAFKQYIKIENEVDVYDLKFYEGVCNNVECVMVQCGVGKVNAARSTQILIDKMNVDYVFNVGVAGGVNGCLKVGDVVIGEKLVQHDFDITPFNHEKGFIPDVGVYVESDKFLQSVAEKVLKKIPHINVHKGVIATGDIFCTDEKMCEKINKKFKALCVEMEGASIAQVCFLSHVPFLILRSISDVSNSDNVVTYEEFLESSCKIIAEALNNILSELGKTNGGSNERSIKK